MQQEKVHPIGLPEWVLDRVDAAFTGDANYIGCVCFDQVGNVALVEPEGHFRGVSATLPKVARAPGERPSQTLVRCLEEKVGAGAVCVYPIPGVWQGDSSRTAFYAVLRASWKSGGPAPSSPHVAAVHDCSFEAALARLAASRNSADRLRDLTLLPVARTIALTPARRLLLMVRALHRMGFERLRAGCSLSPSGMHWRFELFTEQRPERPAAWSASTLEGVLRPKLDVSYSTAMGQRIFGLEETCFESPEELATRLVREAPQVVYAGLGRDPDYARWLDDMLARTAPEGVFVDGLDGDLPVDRACLSNAPADAPRVALAPSAAQPLEPVQVSLGGREDGVWFGRLDDTRLRRAKRWFAWVQPRQDAPRSSAEIARHLKFGSWSTLTEVVGREQRAPATGRPPHPLSRRYEGSWFELPGDDDWRAVTDERTVALYLPPPWVVDKVSVELWALCERADPNVPDGDEGAALDRRIDAVIADLDARLAAQTDVILHHPLFQRLESIWRSLELVVHERGGRSNVCVEMWSCSKSDLSADFEDARSITGTKLHNLLWGLTCGDGPYGLVVGEYEFGPDPADLALLDSIASVCSDAGTPFIASASPRMFGVARWDELSQRDDPLAALSTHGRWRAFRARPESRFVGLCLQRLLLRAPHRWRSVWPRPSFEYDEGADDPSQGLWGSAAAALATRVARSFIALGWCANFVGAEDGEVTNRPTFAVRRDGELRFWRPVEAAFSPTLERALSDAGFIAVSHRVGSSGATFMAARSCHDASSDVVTSEPKAVALGRALSAELPYLCLALRFAHYARAMQREQVGGWRSRDAVWRGVNAWLATLRADDDAPMQSRPLRDARLMLRPTDAGRDDRFEAALYVTPRWTVDGAVVTLPVPVVFPTFW